MREGKRAGDVGQKKKGGGDVDTGRKEPLKMIKERSEDMQGQLIEGLGNNKELLESRYQTAITRKTARE